MDLGRRFTLAERRTLLDKTQARIYLLRRLTIAIRVNVLEFSGFHLYLSHQTRLKVLRTLPPSVPDLRPAPVQLFKQLPQGQIKNFVVFVLHKVGLALAALQKRFVVDRRRHGVPLRHVPESVLIVKVVGPLLNPSACYHAVRQGFTLQFVELQHVLPLLLPTHRQLPHLLHAALALLILVDTTTAKLVYRAAYTVLHINLRVAVFFARLVKMKQILIDVFRYQDDAIQLGFCLRFEAIVFADKLILKRSFDSVLKLYIPKIWQYILLFPSQILQIIPYFHKFKPCSLVGSSPVAQEIGIQTCLTELNHLMANNVLLLVVRSDSDKGKEAGLLYANSRLKVIHDLFLRTRRERSQIQTISGQLHPGLVQRSTLLSEPGYLDNQYIRQLFEVQLQLFQRLLAARAEHSKSSRQYQRCSGAFINSMISYTIVIGHYYSLKRFIKLLRRFLRGESHRCTANYFSTSFTRRFRFGIFNFRNWMLWGTEVERWHRAQKQFRLRVASIELYMRW